MAQTLVKVGDQSDLEEHYKDGDPVVVKDDAHVWGRCECLEVWLSEGLDAADWPGGFVVLTIHGVDESELAFLLMPAATAPRAYKIDLGIIPFDPKKIGTLALDLAQLLALVTLKAPQ